MSSQFLRAFTLLWNPAHRQDSGYVHDFPPPGHANLIRSWQQNISHVRHRPAASPGTAYSTYRSLVAAFLMYHSCGRAVSSISAAHRSANACRSMFKLRSGSAVQWAAYPEYQLSVKMGWLRCSFMQAMADQISIPISRIILLQLFAYNLIIIGMRSHNSVQGGEAPARRVSIITTSIRSW